MIESMQRHSLQYRCAPAASRECVDHDGIAGWATAVVAPAAPPAGIRIAVLARDDNGSGDSSRLCIV